MDLDTQSEDASRCGHIRTLAQLASALRDPLSPLIIDLGGRFFSADGVAARPRQPIARAAQPSEDNIMDSTESPHGHSVDSDSRFAVGAGVCTEEASSSATSSASVHPADTMTSRPSSGLRQPLRRRSARRTAARPLTAPQQHVAQADIEMLPDVEMRDVAEADARAAHADAADALADGLQRLGSDAAFSADTGDDVVQGDVDSDDSDADGTAGGRNQGARHHMAPLGAGGTAAASTDPQFLAPPQFLDIMRPGTVLCHGIIELPENMAIRVTAPCALRDLRLRGPGIAAKEYWGYAYPGLVSIVGPASVGANGTGGCGPPGGRIRVDVTGLELRRVGNSNGIKIAGAADVSIARSSVCNCRRNGIIVQGPAARATLRHTKSFQNEASGLWVVGQGDVSAAHCYFGDNRCNGAACWDAASSLSALRCVFQNNAANGVRYLYGATGTLESCMVAGNQEQGLEAGEAATAVRVRGSTLIGNLAWAVKTYARASVFLRDSSVNRGCNGALSVQASGGSTAVCATHCDFGGTFHVQHDATFSRLPDARADAA
eukprot:jgi/Ulvmu1/6043/UM027_0020.1